MRYRVTQGSGTSVSYLTPHLHEDTALDNYLCLELSCLLPQTLPFSTGFLWCELHIWWSPFVPGHLSSRSLLLPHRASGLISSLRGPQVVPL